MINQPLRQFVSRLRGTLGDVAGSLTDAEVLERFVASRDEAAFEVLVWRHGPMVLGTCARLLHNEQDVEDVFQATFLTLARKAGSIRRGEALAGFLHTTACRTALRVRVRTRQGQCQGLPADVAAPEAEDGVWRDLRPVLDEEIGQLPLKYRLPVILFYLQGKSTEEVAQQLGCARGTVCSRLSWARERLRSRLLRRGLALTGAALALALPRSAVQAMPARLVPATLKGSLAFAAGQSTASAVSTQAVTLAEGAIKAMFVTKLKLTAALLLTVTVAALGTGLLTQQVLADKPAAAPELVGKDGGAIRLPANLLPNLGLQVAEIRPRLAAVPRILRLEGSTGLDPAGLARIRSRVTGEVVEIGQVPEDGETRPIRPGDKVNKGQLLVVIWSKEVGEKKGELFDAQVQSSLSQAILAQVEQMHVQNLVPEVELLRAQRTAMGDQNAVARAERTLRLWRVPEEDIKAVRVEAARVARLKGKLDPEKEKNLARVEIRSPQDGTVVERNVVKGEVISDTTTNLFTIAKLDRLLVVVNVPEDDLPALLALPAASRKWKVQAVGQAAPIEGKIDEVGYLIDPSQHTSTAKGTIDNPGPKLRAGQFITATITLPAATHEIVIPASAVVEEGGVSFVFVQPDPKQLVYRQRRVLVVRRGREVVHVRSPLSAEEEKQGFQPLRSGERIVTSAAVELKALLDDLKKEKR